MKATLVVIGCMALLTSGAHAQAADATLLELAGPYPKDFDELSQEAIKVRLKDPYSAVINVARKPRLMSLGKGRKQDAVWSTCYTVNAKNSYGGFTGEKIYVTAIRYGGVIAVASEDGYRFGSRQMRQECLLEETAAD